MALHTQLPIHKTGCALLGLIFRAQEQMPRGMKRHLGDKIASHGIEILDLMALANIHQGMRRAEYIKELLAEVRTTEVLMRVAFDSKYIAKNLWGDAAQLLESIGKQGSGWLKSAQGKQKTAPAA